MAYLSVRLEYDIILKIMVYVLNIFIEKRVLTFTNCYKNNTKKYNFLRYYENNK